MKPVFFLVMAGLLSGCVTPRGVDKMISEKLQPEMERIDVRITETAAQGDTVSVKVLELQQFFNERMEELQNVFSAEQSAAAKQMEEISEQIKDFQTVIEEEKALTASRIQILSMAVSKTQESLELIQEKINEVQNLYAAQQQNVKTMRSQLDAQNESLLAVFRKQKEDLSGIIAELDRHLERGRGAAELTAPAPVPAEPQEGNAAP